MKPQNLLNCQANKFILLILICLSPFMAISNGITISNITLVDQHPTIKSVNVNFDLYWENSWRTSTYESNWDAAWIFIKYRVKGSNVWYHATLNTSEHIAPGGSTISTASDGKGAFIYKSSDGIGSNTFNSVKLRWNYGVDGLSNADLVEIKVFGIEMVYVPQGSYYLGDGTSTNIQGQFESRISGAPFQVTSENAITLGGGGVGSLGNNNAFGMSKPDDFKDATVKTLPAEFPKGYNAFYCMKYEISQSQYVEFLNLLTYNQQVTRTANLPNSVSSTPALSNTYRNGIDIQIPGISPGTPAVYASNLSDNGNFNDDNDGQNIGCNFLSWADLAAYLDWSGLRPMTELEYEKACRGKITPVANEYAWGNLTVREAQGIAHIGSYDEAAFNNDANVTYSNHPSARGPLRVGSYARATTDRTSSGGSYYGIMDLSGNAWERVMSVGNTTERSFTGNHGNGAIDADGNADVLYWPNSSTGIGARGGNWETDINSIRVSDRKSVNDKLAIRDRKAGGRGVRTAP